MHGTHHITSATDHTKITQSLRLLFASITICLDSKLATKAIFIEQSRQIFICWFWEVLAAINFYIQEEKALLWYSVINFFVYSRRNIHSYMVFRGIRCRNFQLRSSSSYRIYFPYRDANQPLQQKNLPGQYIQSLQITSNSLKLYLVANSSVVIPYVCFISSIVRSIR